MGLAVYIMSLWCVRCLMEHYHCSHVSLLEESCDCVPCDTDALANNKNANQQSHC